MNTVWKQCLNGEIFQLDRSEVLLEWKFDDAHGPGSRPYGKLLRTWKGAWILEMGHDGYLDVDMAAAVPVPSERIFRVINERMADAITESVNVRKGLGRLVAHDIVLELIQI